MNTTELAKEILSNALFIPKSSIADDNLLNNFKGMDSLSFEAVALEIERVTGRDPDPLIMLEMQTVSDLAKLIEEMLGSRG